jgi:putative phosphonate metabolism protein
MIAGLARAPILPPRRCDLPISCQSLASTIGGLLMIADPPILRRRPRVIRYAIYFMPAPESPLWRFGSAVLGYDADGGDPVKPPPGLFSTASARDYVAEPQKYGFHATLKAPFALSAGCQEHHLFDHARAFVRGRRPFVVNPLRIAPIGPFLALVPSRREADLDALANDCVCEFDGFRAAASAEELARRRAASLTLRQSELLERWGYPYVFEEFCFHMTLTSRLPARVHNQFHRALESLYAPIAEPLRIDSIAIFRQSSSTDRFRVLQRFLFGAPA